MGDELRRIDCHRDSSKCGKFDVATTYCSATRLSFQSTGGCVAWREKTNWCTERGQDQPLAPPSSLVTRHSSSTPARASNQPSPLSTSHSSRRSGHPGRYTPPSPTPPNSGWVVALRLTPVPRYWFAGVPFTCSLVLLPESERAAGSDPDRAQTRLARLLTIFPGRFCLESAELSWPFHSPHCVRSGPSRLKIGHTVRSWSATKG
jgi:hypothetical protein